MAFCVECGTNVPDEIKFCTACGKPMKQETPQPVAQMPDLVLGTPAPTPVQPQPVPVQSAPLQPAPMPVVSPYAPSYAPPVTSNVGGSGAPAPDSPYAVMSTGAYVGFSILFSLPLIGWLICLIVAFASKNLNRRNYARALLIFMLIGLVVGIIVGVSSYFLLHEAFQQLGGMGDFGNGEFLREFITVIQ